MRHTKDLKNGTQCPYNPSNKKNTMIVMFLTFFVLGYLKLLGCIGSQGGVLMRRGLLSLSVVGDTLGVVGVEAVLLWFSSGDRGSDEPLDTLCLFFPLVLLLILRRFPDTPFPLLRRRITVDQ